MYTETSSPSVVADPWLPRTSTSPLAPEPGKRFIIDETRSASMYITKAEFERAYYGVAFANYHGFVLNVDSTIAWQCMGYRSVDEIDKAFKAYKELARRFLKDKKFAPADGAILSGGAYKHPFFHYAVFENGRHLGYHSHEALYVPQHLLGAFEEWQQEYFEKNNPSQYRKALVSRYRVSATPTNQWFWFRYCMKGLQNGFPARDRLAVMYGKYSGLCKIAGIRSVSGLPVKLRRVRLSRDMCNRSMCKTGYETPIDIWYPAYPDRYNDVEYQRGVQDRWALSLNEATRMERI